MSDKLFDIGQRKYEFLTGKTNGIALSAKAGSTTDTVDIVFGVLRQIVIEYMTDVGDMQAAGGNIGGDQYRQFTLLETLQQADAFRLWNVSR